MRRRRRIATAALIVAACATPSAPPPTLAFVDVAVVDVDAGIAEPARTVLIVEGRIEAVGPSGDVTVPDESIVIGRGGFLLPGLIDLHGHDVENEKLLSTWTAHGVTTVRGMGGDPEASLTVRDRIERGELDGPRLVVPGPFLDGEKPGARHRIVVRTEGEGRAAVRELHANGVDFLKVHSLVAPEAYFAIAEEAQELGLRFAGHVPAGVTELEAISAGQGSIEHVTTLAERALSPAAVSSGEAFERDLAAYLGGPGGAIIDALVERGTAFVPTLIGSDAIARAVDPDTDVWDDPRLATTPAGTREDWQRLLPVDLLPPDFHAQRIAVERAACAIVEAMHRAGVRILAGSDAGAPHVYWGSALIDELELLQRCGLGPEAALRSATCDAADFLGLTNVTGRVRVGLSADLVQVAENPLIDVNALRAIGRVVVRGRVARP